MHQEVKVNVNTSGGCTKCIAQLYVHVLCEKKIVSSDRNCSTEERPDVV